MLLTREHGSGKLDGFSMLDFLAYGIKTIAEELSCIDVVDTVVA